MLGKSGRINELQHKNYARLEMPAIFFISRFRSNFSKSITFGIFFVIEEEDNLPTTILPPPNILSNR